MAFWGKKDSRLYRGDPAPGPAPGSLPPADPPASAHDEWATAPGTGPWAHPPGTGPWAGEQSSSGTAELPEPPRPIVVAIWLGRAMGFGILAFAAVGLVMAIIGVVSIFGGDDAGSTFWGVFGALMVAFLGAFVVGLGWWFLGAAKALKQHSALPMFLVCGATVVFGLAGASFVADLVAVGPLDGIEPVLRVAVVVVPVVIMILLMFEESVTWRRRPNTGRGMWRSF